MKNIQLIAILGIASFALSTIHAHVSVGVNIGLLAVVILDHLWTTKENCRIAVGTFDLYIVEITMKREDRRIEDRKGKSIMVNCTMIKSTKRKKRKNVTMMTNTCF
jgi:hypothetical protein